MKECPTCNLCFENLAKFCPNDGTELVESLGGNRELDGRWRLERVVGVGQAGTVYAAVDAQTGGAALVKTTLPGRFPDESSVAELLADAKRLERVSHPNVARLYGAGRLPNGAVYQAVEYVEGPTLRETLREALERELDVELALEIAAAVAAALDAIHAAGIVHGDVKPENVLLERAEGGERPKLVDAGAGRWLYGPGGSSMTSTGRLVIRLPHYTAPELSAGEAGDARSDLYALGCVLYEMLTGRPPFEGPTPVAVFMKHASETPAPPSRSREGVSSAVDRIVAQTLAKRPEERFQTAAALEAALRHVCGAARAGGAVGAASPAVNVARVGIAAPPSSENRRIPPPPSPLPMHMTIVDAGDESHVSRRIDGLVRDMGENGMRIETGTVMTGRLSVIRDHTTAFKNRLEVEVELPDGPVRISGFAAWYRPAPDGVNWNVGLYIRDMPAADRARYQAYLDKIARGA